MGFRSGNESTVSLFFFLLSNEGERDSLLALSKQTLTLAFAVNRPSNEFLLWSNCVASDQSSWENNLMIPSLIKRDPKSNGNVCWREYLKPVLSIRWPSLKVDPFTGVDWPSQFITLQWWHPSHHTPQGNTQNNNITAAQLVTSLMLWLPVWFIKWLTVRCCCFLSGLLYKILHPTKHTSIN